MHRELVRMAYVDCAWFSFWIALLSLFGAYIFSHFESGVCIADLFMLLSGGVAICTGVIFYKASTTLFTERTECEIWDTCAKVMATLLFCAGEKLAYDLSPASYRPLVLLMAANIGATLINTYLGYIWWSKR